MRLKRKNRKKRLKKRSENDDPRETEILSQEEIDRPLAVIEAGGAIFDAASAGGVEPAHSRPAPDCCKIRIYDFKRPDRFSREQIRAMAVPHETFAREAAFVLTNRFKTPCHVHAASVDQLTYEEYTRSIPMPATLAAVNVGKPLSRQAAFEIDPAITFAFINRAFGGDGRGVPPPLIRRPSDAREFLRVGEKVAEKNTKDRETKGALK